MTPCIEYQGTRRPDGYGVLRVDGRNVRAHRVAYESAFGPIPDGLWVLHRCDNPPCVNPDHLWAGTAAENSEDMKAKGRSKTAKRWASRRIGELNGSHRLTEPEVISIRRQHAEGATIHGMSREYGVARPTIKRVIRGVTWRYLL